ncbi:RsmB/NOP family class I SAM-dependent RNA methyltransferase [Microbacterium sp. YY-01]|uniref:RsmB/NOP family class I SAM-dependent RNA methyltransferase n=1 Tax=Microbacterium sp. YY-01 TaxID=3421634 RepID=UPI003D17CDA0
MSTRKPQRVQPARSVAYSVIRAVADNDAYANLALPAALRAADVQGPDAALATELTYGTLRGLGTYDAIISHVARRPVDRIDPPVLDALRLGVHQLLSMRVATHAAVNESVALASFSGRSAAGFANAVLRKVAGADRDSWMLTLRESARSDDEKLALETSHPVWIIRALRRALRAEGRELELADLLAADNASPSVTLAVLPGLGEPVSEPRPYAATAYEWRSGDPAEIVEQSDGRVRVQDEGSQIAAWSLAEAAPIRHGERWLDLCAGPGGKTALLAAIALQSGVALDANEVVPARAGLVRRAVAAVPLPVAVHEEDGREFAEAHAKTYDRILVDAPCTGLGALRRRPEARWRKQPSDIPALVTLQESLLSAAVTALVPGGIVAYVTCSPHQAETRDVVAAVLRKHDDLVELNAREIVARVAQSPIDVAPGVDGSGSAQLWPHRHGTDAMFIAVLRRGDGPKSEARG